MRLCLLCFSPTGLYLQEFTTHLRGPQMADLWLARARLWECVSAASRETRSWDFQGLLRSNHVLSLLFVFLGTPHFGLFWTLCFTVIHFFIYCLFFLYISKLILNRVCFRKASTTIKNKKGCSEKISCAHDCNYQWVFLTLISCYNPLHPMK